MTAAADRFKGEAGHRRLAEAWAAQAFGAGDQNLAKLLAEVSKVETFDAGEVVFNQGDAGSDFYLTLIGAVVIETHGRAGPTREAGTHFGEMTLIDVNARRSATVRAAEETVVARVTESDFAKLAGAYPVLWRCLAVEIARRLRQRLLDVPRKNEKPFVFIGSSREGLTVANAIKAAIEDDRTDVRVWTDGVFGASATTIESLEQAVRAADVAVLVFSPDDKLRSRGETHVVPRDNVIFELGLFMGALGRDRAFVVRPRAGLRTTLSGIVGKLLDLVGPQKLSIKVPTDLLGVTLLTYEEGEPATLAARLAPACDELKRTAARLGAK